MSNAIDQRIVEMQFDNKQFEAGVETTMSTLDKLKQKLNLGDAAKGFDAIDTAANKIDSSKLSSSIESIANRFTLMGNVVQGVYMRISNAILGIGNQATQFVKDLTITPVTTGMQEYETQINAIQTIMSNTQESLSAKGLDEAGRLDRVNTALDELNTYADKTIYNFTEMTRNIGTFTAAGVDLDTATASIKGIANLAAASGSTSLQASTAMYQLSQAIASGTVKLQDWNSVVNAGMGGELFQEALKRTAKHKGIDVEAIIAKKGSFRESLSEGWLSKDVLTETLSQMTYDFEAMAKAEGYAGDTLEEGIELAKENMKAQLISEGYTSDEAEAIVELAQNATEAATKVKTFTQLFDTLKEAAQSGWTQSWEYIIGDFEEAKELLTDISDFFGEIIQNSADARNNLLQQWHEAGGRDALIKSFWNIVYAIQNVVTTIKGAFQEVFPPATLATLSGITLKFWNFTKAIRAFTEDAEQMDKIRRIVSGIANALDIVRQVFSGMWTIVKHLFSVISPYGGDMLELFAKLGDKITEFNRYLKETDAIDNVVSNVTNFITTIATNLDPAISKIKEFFSSISAGRDAIGGVTTDLKEMIDATSFVDNIKGFVSNFAETIKQQLKNADGVSVAAIVSALGLGGIALKIAKFVAGLNDMRKKISDGVESVSEAMSDTIGSFNLNAKSKSKKFMLIAAGVLELALAIAAVAAALWIIAQIDSDKLVPAVLVLAGIMVALTAVAIVLGKTMKLSGAASFLITAIGLIALGAALNIVVQAVKSLSDIDGDSLIKGLLGMGAILIGLGAFAFVVSKLRIKIPLTTAASLILVAQAISVIASAVIKPLGEMDADALKRGLVGLGAAMLELAIFMNLIRGVKFGILNGIGFLLLGATLAIITMVIKQISEMDTDTLTRGLDGLGAAMLELAVFMNLIRGVKFGILNGIGFLLLGVTLAIITRVIKQIGEMDADVLKRGLVGLGAAMLELAVFMNLIRGVKFGLLKGLGFILLGNALTTIAYVIKQLGEMNDDALARGLVGLGAVMLELLAFVALMKKLKIRITNAVALILLGKSMVYFSTALIGIGGLDSNALMRGVTGLGAVMLEILAFTAIMKRVGASLTTVLALVGMAAAINGFVMTIEYIGKLSIETILKGIVGLGVVLLELVAFSHLVSSVGSVTLLKLVGMIGILSAVMIAFSVALRLLQDIPYDKMLTFSLSIGTALLSLTATLAILSAMPFSMILASTAKLGVAITVISGIMALLGAAEREWGVSSYIEDFGNILEAIGTAIGRFVGGFAGGFMRGLNLPLLGTELSNFIGNIQPFIEGVKNLDGSSLAGIGQLTLLLLALSAAEFINAITALLGGQNPVVAFVGELSILATGLNSFVASMDGFGTENAETLDAAISCAQSLVSLVNAIPWSAPIWATALIGSNDVTAFAIMAVGVAAALKLYAAGLTGFSTLISAADVTNSTTAATALSALAEAIPSTGGWAQAILGVKDLGDFGDDVATFAAGLKTYAQNISGFSYLVSESDVTGSTSAAQGLVDLANSLPGESGWMQQIMGVKDLGDFGGDIAVFATGLKQYAESINGFSETVSQEDIDNSTAAAKGLSDLANSLPAQDGILQRIIGVQNLGDFGDAIVEFADGLVQYAEATTAFGEIDEDDLENANTVAKGLVDLANALPEDDGILQRIMGVQNLANFGTDVSLFADGLVAYAEKVSGFSGLISSDDIKKATTVGTGLSELLGTLPETGGWLQTLIGQADLASFGSQCSNFGGGIAKFAESIADIDLDNSDDALATAQSIIDFMGGLNKEGGFFQAWSGFWNGTQDITSLSGKIATFGTDFSTFTTGLLGAGSAKSNFESAKDVLNSFIQLASDIKNSDIDTWDMEYAAEMLGTAFVGTVSNTLSVGVSSVVGKVITMGNAVNTGAYNAFLNAGKHLGSGIANGINALASTIRSRAMSAAQGAINAIAITWQIHSPSRVGKDMGMNFDLGIAGGISEYSQVIESESQAVGQNAVDAARRMLVGTDASIFDYMDTTPTIRPVLDLSNVQSGIGQMDGMFSNDPTLNGKAFSSINVRSNVGQLQFDGARIAGGQTDKDIISEIRTLSNKLGELGEAVTNMQLVLDTGTLVGATSAAMDAQLGVLAMRRGRGN